MVKGPSPDEPADEDGAVGDAGVTDPISFRIKAEIKQALERLAKEDKRCLSQYIELALEANIEAKRSRRPRE